MTIEAVQDMRSLMDAIEKGLKDNAEYIAKHGNPSIYEGDLIPGNFGNTGPWFSNEVLQKAYNETLEPDGIDAEDYSIRYYLIDEKGVSYYVRRSDQTVDDIKPAPTITVGEWVMYREQDNAIANLYTPTEELDELLLRHSKRKFIPHDMQSYPVPGKDYTTAVKVDHNDVPLPSEIQRVARMAMDNGDTKPITQKPKLSLVPDPKTEAKSSPGRVKRAGASCKGSATSLRKKAKDSSGEKSKMYHWCANMKAGKKRSIKEVLD
jgi:hypothetical protein